METRTVVEYRTDPEVQKQLEQSKAQVQQMTNCLAQLQKEYENAKEEARKLQNPQKYEELKEQAFIAFVNNIHKLKFTDKIPKKDGHRHFVAIGNISVGKSSLLNYIYKLNLAVGMG